MTGEIPLLTPEQVALAEKRIGFNHPVIGVIDRNRPQFAWHNQAYSGIKDTQEQQRYIAGHYGFLADDLVAAGQFTLDPLDVIAIWSRAMEVFSGYHRYALAKMVGSSFAIQGLKNPDWKKFPRHLLETHELPSEVVSDKSGLLHVRSRLEQVSESLKGLEFYVFGTREPSMTRAFNLAKKESEGDKEAKKQLKELIAREARYSTPVIREIHENFGNGFTPLYFSVNGALEALGEPAL